MLSKPIYYLALKALCSVLFHSIVIIRLSDMVIYGTVF